MTSKEQEKDRRKHQRHNISGSAFALLKWNGSEVLGSITDISTGGFCLSHIDDYEELEDHSRLTANLISEKNCYENFMGRCIWSSKDEGDFATAIVNMKRCGIEFENLNDELHVQLKDFIATLEEK
jgi:hypothetical protein